MKHLVLSEAGLVQLVATNLVTAGYYHYVAGTIPADKDPARTDANILGKYMANLPRHERVYRKRHAKPNLRYVRLAVPNENDVFSFLMMATDGDQSDAWFREEDHRDLRKSPLCLSGYAISAKKERTRGGTTRYRVRVAIEREEFRRLKAYFLDLARHRAEERFIADFLALPYQPYRTVRGQLFNILVEANRVRKKAGFSRLYYGILPRRRRIVRVFSEDAAQPA